LALRYFGEEEVKVLLRMNGFDVKLSGIVLCSGLRYASHPYKNIPRHSEVSQLLFILALHRGENIETNLLDFMEWIRKINVVMLNKHIPAQK
jgi:hypothetical protein